MIQNFYMVSKLISLLSGACWLFLLGMIVFNLLRKNTRKGNVWILYLLNSSVLYVANRDMMHALSSASQVETLPVLTNEAITNNLYLSGFNAIVFLVAISILNVCYSYWVIKNLEMKRIVALFFIDAGILILGLVGLYSFLTQLSAA